MTKKLKLPNGEVVLLEVHKNTVVLTNKNGEFVSFNPSMKSTGISTVDVSSVLIRTMGEVC